MQFSECRGYDRSLVTGAKAAIKDVLALKKDERILIISNPNRDVREISMAIFDAAMNVKAKPVLMFQREKGQFDFAEKDVISAMSSEPDVILSISKDRFGKDKHGLLEGYMGKRKYNDIFEMLYEEEKARAFWSPGITRDMFRRTVPIDYTRLRKDCKRICAILKGSETVRVTAPGGTDLVIGSKGRIAKMDDGDFRKKGRGGNVPSGEVYVSPALGTTNGVIAFDGSIVLNDGEIVMRDPIVAQIKDGYITKIDGRKEANALRNSIRIAKRKARSMGNAGLLKSSEVESYIKNTESIGELGIGLNRKAKIVANMLEDEKVYGTCHFAVGSNYDGDADSLIHLDGLVKSPTITAVSSSGRETEIMRKGKLTWD